MTDENKAAYEKAVDFFTIGKYEEAVQVLLEIIKRDPKHSDAHESLGMIRYKQGKLDDAIEWMKKLSQIRPDYAMAYTNLSVFYMKKGLKELAEEAKAKAVVLNFGKI